MRKKYHCFNWEIFKLPQLWLYIRYNHNFWFCGMVFGVGQLNDASHIWLKQTLFAMMAKICDF